MRSAAAAILPLALLASACERSSYREADVALSAPAAPPAAEPPAPRALRFSVAAVESPRDTYVGYSRILRRIGERLGMPVTFVQRRTYREVNDLLAAGELDAALVCTGGYLGLRGRAADAVEVLAVPVVDGALTYESLVIVPTESTARTFADLVGRRFAFTDELSFSGHAYVRHLVRRMNQDPERFFGSTIYTHSHDRSIQALVRGMADGAAVHGGVWGHLTREDPDLLRRLRVLHRSPPFGAMPVVVSTQVAPELRARLRDELLALAADPEGAAALHLLGIDRFAAPPDGLYDSASRVVEESR